jgi:hypothetical protein
VIAWPVWPLAARARAPVAEPLPATDTDWSSSSRSSSETRVRFGVGGGPLPGALLVSVATKTSPDSKAEPALAVGAPNAMTEPPADVPRFEPAASAAIYLAAVLGPGKLKSWMVLREGKASRRDSVRPSVGKRFGRAA